MVDGLSAAIGTSWPVYDMGLIPKRRTRDNAGLVEVHTRLPDRTTREETIASSSPLRRSCQGQYGKYQAPCCQPHSSFGYHLRWKFCCDLHAIFRLEVLSGREWSSGKGCHRQVQEKPSNGLSLVSYYQLARVQICIQHGWGSALSIGWQERTILWESQSMKVQEQTEVLLKGIQVSGCERAPREGRMGFVKPVLTWQTSSMYTSKAKLCRGRICKRPKTSTECTALAKGVVCLLLLFWL